MPEYSISRVFPSDPAANAQVDRLLLKEGIRRDKHLDYTCAVFDGEQRAIATGSCFGNTLRCLAVDSAHRGEGLMNQIVTHLIETQYGRGNTHLFLYTKTGTANIFSDLGFYEIARVNGALVFMENRRNGFSGYLKSLAVPPCTGPSAAVVLNANPFTLGHLALVETAARENERLHLFVVSEDKSLVPFAVRKRLILEGTAHLKNLCYHDCGPYLISNATFPSYFQRDEQEAIEGHARLDVEMFKRIAAALSIGRRYLGEEPASLVTGIYNEVMQAELPRAGIGCVVISRRQYPGGPISASTARRALQEGNFALFRQLVPETTWRYFQSAGAAPVLEAIRQAAEVGHY